MRAGGIRVTNSATAAARTARLRVRRWNIPPIATANAKTATKPAYPNALLYKPGEKLGEDERPMISESENNAMIRRKAIAESDRETFARQSRAGGCAGLG